MGVAIFGGAGCQTLAPPQQQQLEAAEEVHYDLNPEFAQAAEVIGTLLYYVLPFVQCYH